MSAAAVPSGPRLGTVMLVCLPPAIECWVQLALESEHLQLVCVEHLPSDAELGGSVGTLVVHERFDLRLLTGMVRDDRAPGVVVLSAELAPALVWALALIGIECIWEHSNHDEIRAAVRRAAHGAPLVLEQLTKREREVLSRLQRGESPAWIAQELHVSPATVRTHMQNLRRKFRVRTTRELVVTSRSPHVI